MRSSCDGWWASDADHDAVPVFFLREEKIYLLRNGAAQLSKSETPTRISENPLL